MKVNLVSFYSLKTDLLFIIKKQKLKTIISEFTHVMLKVCVKLAAFSAEWPGRRKTYGPGETQ